MSRINDTMVEGVIKHTRLSQYYTIYIILVAFIIPAVSAILSYGILISKMAKFDKQRQPVTRSSSDTASKPGTLNYSKTIYRRATWVVSIFMFTLAPYIALNYSAFKSLYPAPKFGHFTEKFTPKTSKMTKFRRRANVFKRIVHRRFLPRFNPRFGKNLANLHVHDTHVLSVLSSVQPDFRANIVCL